MNEQEMQAAVSQILGAVLKKIDSPAARPSSSVEDGPIPVELSARHVHLSEQDVQTLLGAPLTHVRDLSQPGQFLSAERVRLVGPKGVMDNVSILGPARSSSQVEISMTDARALGVAAPVRQSGDTAGSPGIIITSPSGMVRLSEGVIVASRHIHMTPEDAARFGVSDGDMVDVRLNSSRPVVYCDVLVRVSSKFSLAMHIDTDEGNAAGWKKDTVATIVARRRG